MAQTQDRTPARAGDPGYGRDEDLERERRSDRPAKADMDADDRKADRAPGEHIHYAPQPEDGLPDPQGVKPAIRHDR